MRSNCAAFTGKRFDLQHQAVAKACAERPGGNGIGMHVWVHWDAEIKGECELLACVTWWALVW